jgi:hypothetical protein
VVQEPQGISSGAVERVRVAQVDEADPALAFRAIPCHSDGYDLAGNFAYFSATRDLLLREHSAPFNGAAC